MLLQTFGDVGRGGGLFGLAPAGPDDLVQSQSHVVGQSGEHTHVA